MKEMTLFQQFDPVHLWTLLLIALISIGCAFLGYRKTNNVNTVIFPWGLALFLIGNEIYIHAAAISFGEWRVSWALPLHLCDLSLLAVMVALIWKNQIAWELAFYWGLGGSIPAMITPDIPLAFPHFYFVTFFIHHGGIIFGVLYLAFSGKYPLPFSSIKRVWIITHVYVLFIAIFNFTMKTNYLFLCSKPSQPSLIDYLGPWPLYILGLEVIFTFSLFFLYWVFHRVKSKKDTS